VVGVFHVHSTWSDGTAEIADMAEKCRKMGFKYMGLSDHSKAAAYAGGLTEDRLRKQMREVDELNNGWKDFRILKGLECDILPDGSMDMTSEILGKLDFVIGSVHSRFDMSEKEMTDRICKALTNKHLDILGHPTGRLLLSREPYKVDLERVLQEAKRARKVIELNANPHRLDLDWVHVKRAHDLGVMISIGPDAHSTQGIEDIVYGVATARRGWLSAGDILNTRTADEALEWLNHD
ncbi:MAG: PHP domain-containing protein, partial [Planctomycetes bacterium]|nr:PHP domain-containing protein [Planctomycetota bacterium]